MTNTEKIQSILTPMLSDIFTTPDEVVNLIDMVYNELAYECKPVKKLYQLTLFEGVSSYDLESIVLLQEQYEEGITGATITSALSNTEDIITMMKTLKAPDISPEIEFTTENLNLDVQVIAIDDIITDDGKSVMDKFTLLFGNTYDISDKAFLAKMNDISLYFIASITVPLDNVAPNIFPSLVSPIIHGVKFYLYNTPQTRELDQGNNLMAMRFFKAKEILINQYPQKLNFKSRSTRWL